MHDASNGLLAQGPLRAGNTGERVLALRSLVDRASPEPVTPTGPPDVFDCRLEAAVRAFQQRRGLLADGVVGAQTLRALEGARWRLGDRVLLLVPGHPMRGDDVAALQERLVVLGLLAGPVDGVFGPRTDNALRELQRSLGIDVDGTCGPGTLRAMDALARAVGGGDPSQCSESTTSAPTCAARAARVTSSGPS